MFLRMACIAKVIPTYSHSASSDGRVFGRVRDFVYSHGLSEQCNGLGGMLLATVLRWVGNDSAGTGRDPYIMTQINPDNHASMRLFKAYGFSDEGADEMIPNTTYGQGTSKGSEPISYGCPS